MMGCMTRTKFLMIAIPAGVVVGLGAIGWIRLHPHDEPVATSKGGSVVLETPPPIAGAVLEGGAPTPTPELQVKGSGSELGQGLGSSLSGSQSGSGSSFGSGPSSDQAAQVPGPDDFGQYDAYKDKPSALFGDLIVGTGEEVAAGKTVSVGYRGWLTNGTLFDENYTSQKAFSFVEGEHKVIAGWEEGLFGMKVGGKRRLIVPPGRGYGSETHGPIPGNSVLVFDVDLVAVQ
jgi:FKBP-type peptidyl-prolyl cis-trans isomerase FkpA